MQARRLLTALAAAFIVSAAFTLWLGSRLSRQHNNNNGRLRYVAPAKDMEAGELLTPDDLKLVSWPDAAPLHEAFTRKEDLVGKSVLYPLQDGQPIGPRQLGSGAGLSNRIPAGMRAISLKSNEIVGVAGYLLPGTRVDVLVTVRPMASPDPVTSTVLQDAQVLTAGEKMQPDPEGRASKVDVVTLLVTPQDAEKVVLASSQGTVHFVLRNGADHAFQKQEPMRLTMLSAPDGIPSPIPPRAAVTYVAPQSPKQARSKPTAAPYSISIRRGDKDSVETF